jgi:hypothetical protein
MVLKRDSYRGEIEAMSLADWQPLLALIPEIEQTTSFYRESDTTEDDDALFDEGFEDDDEEDDEDDELDDEDIIELDVYRATAQVVHHFRELVYEVNIVVDFDWPGWDEGRAMLRDPHFDFDTIDIPTKCLLITAIVRNVRFCDGALAAAFESGDILKILKSIQKQLKMRSPESETATEV